MGPFSRTLSILGYHRVLAEPDPLVSGHPSAKEFESQLVALGRWFKVLPLSRAVAMLRNGSLPARSACITFDDGYADNASIALPILRRHGMAATFFITTGVLNGGRMWNDTVIEAVRRAREKTIRVGSSAFDISTLDSKQSAINQLLKWLKYLPFEERQRRADDLAAMVPTALPDDLMMTGGDVSKLLSHGMEVGAHTVNHPILSNLTEDRAYAEIRDSKRALEALTGNAVTLFAYPNGKPGVDYLSSHVSMVQELKFEAAVSTAWGVGTGKSDPHELPRFTPWEKTPARFLLRMLHNTLRTSPAVAAA